MKWHSSIHFSGIVLVCTSRELSAQGHVMVPRRICFFLASKELTSCLAMLWHAMACV